MAWHLADELGGRLGAGVRVRGLQDGVLDCAFPKHIAIHLVRRHVDKELDLLACAGALEQRVGPQHVGLCVDEGISEL